MSRWWPIDTAPRDGEAVMLCFAGTDHVVAYYDDGYPLPWRDPLYCETIGYAENQVTHWMHLPPLPASQVR